MQITNEGFVHVTGVNELPKLVLVEAMANGVEDPGKVLLKCKIM
jgi:hypothetical protein